MNINNVYFPTWTESLNWGENYGTSDLAKIPKYINYVTISFLRPNPNNFNLDNTMDTIFYDGDISLRKLKQEIAACKSNGGKERVVLASVGGEIAGNFLETNFKVLALSIYELGLDGIDIDYEPNGVMTESAAEIKKYVELIEGIRIELDLLTKVSGKEYILSCAPTGIGLFNRNEFDNISKKFSYIKERLKGIVNVDEESEELNWGSILDSNTLKQPKFNVGTVGSAFNFNSAGKMLEVFMSKSKSKNYTYVGQMLNLVLYQAYNIGSGNILAKLLCYETHKELSEFFNCIKSGSGFRIGHGSHVGKEAWPHFSYTKRRLEYIYSYIKKYGRNGDGASFWSYSSSIKDDSDNVPPYGMWYKSNKELFKHVRDILN